MSDEYRLEIIPPPPIVRAFTDEQFERLMAALGPDPAAVVAHRNELVKALYTRIGALENQLRKAAPDA